MYVRHNSKPTILIEQMLTYEEPKKKKDSLFVRTFIFDIKKNKELVEFD